MNATTVGYLALGWSLVALVIALLFGALTRVGGEDDPAGPVPTPLPAWPAWEPNPPVEPYRTPSEYRITVLEHGVWRPLLVGFEDFAAATRFVVDAGIADHFEGYAVEVKTTEWALAYSVEPGGTSLGLGLIK